MASNQRDRWSSLAGCKSLSPEESDKVFFDPSPGRPSKDPLYSKYCGPCKVTKQCFEWAVVHEVQGIWGNTTKNQRDNPLLSPYKVKLTEQAVAEGWLESYPAYAAVPPLVLEVLAVVEVVVVETRKFLFEFERVALVQSRTA